MDSAKLLKNNAKAAQFRQEGNQLYKKKQFEAAMNKYNESICWAETDSTDIAIAYANRSAVAFELDEFEFALMNIVLAKKHNYPEALMAKLEVRERSCQQQLIDPERVKLVEERAILYPNLTLNVEVNPRIPFIAKDVHSVEDARGYTNLIADRNFKVGDVILDEQSFLGCLNPNSQYGYCDHCTDWYPYVLIPCTRCVSAMYCSEECREESWNRFHRYECDIIQQIHETVEKTKCSHIAAKFFLYGLNLFKDDVEKMMEFYKTHPRTGSNRLGLDFINYDPLEEFKAIHMMKQPETLTTLLFPVKWIGSQFYKVYQKSSVIKSLFNTKAKKDFMLQAFHDYFHAFPWFWTGECRFHRLNTIATLVNRKPFVEANITSLASGGRIKLIVHRAVPKGAYLILQDKDEPELTVCDSSKCPPDCRERQPNRDMAIMLKVLGDPQMHPLTCMNALRQFLQKYSHLHSRCFFLDVVKSFQELLGELRVDQVGDELRAKVLAGITMP